MSPMIWKDYWSWKWIARWFFPLRLLVWVSIGKMGMPHVWYQSKTHELVLRRREP